MKEVWVVQMSFPFRGFGSAARGPLILVALMGEPAHGATLDTVATTLDMALARARLLIEQAVRLGQSLYDEAVTSTGHIRPDALLAGLVSLSVLVAAIGIWLLVRRPHGEGVATGDELDLAAFAQPGAQPGMDVRAGGNRPPRLLDAVAAMKAQAALSAVNRARR